MTSLLQRPAPVLPDRLLRRLARAGWSSADVQAAVDLAGEQVATVLADVLDGGFPDRTPATVLAWLRVGGAPLLAAFDDPVLRRRQSLAMRSWSGTYGALGPLGHAAGLSLVEAAHLLALGELTPALLRTLAAGREPAAVLHSWADGLHRRS